MHTSTTRTILILAGFVLIVVGLAWWLISMRPAASPTVPYSSTFFGQSKYSSGVSTPSQSAPTSSTAPANSAPLSNLDTQYTALFAQAGVSVPHFLAVSSVNDPLLGAVYVLFGSDIAQDKKLYPQQGTFSMDMASVDLNGDGVPEVLVYENLHGYCGSGGCQVYVFVKQGSSWHALLTALGSEMVGVSVHKTNGYDDLLLSVPGAVGYQTQVQWYIFNGTSYQPGSVFAMWNGTSFIKD